jgi:hypothetical protein
VNIPTFAGRAGEAVPQVEPDDIKAVWTIFQEVARTPGERVAVGADFVKASCRPGADVAAVAYRSGMLHALVKHAPELAPWIANGEPADALFRAAAQTRMEWIGEELRHGWPFDWDEFLRRVRGEIT